MTLRAATRGSALAVWQADHVVGLLANSSHRVEVVRVVVSTAGDRDKVTPIQEIGGKGLFVKEVQAAVLEGRADIAVHSAKDLQADTTDGLVLAAIPSRADPRDALVGARLEELRVGATIGTGSVRRQVQLEALRPDLKFEQIRGNIDTRLGLVGRLDAIVMAAAALDRLGLAPGTVDRLDVGTMVPQVGQGALAIECRADDDATIALLAEIEDESARRMVEAERAFLAELGGDCDLPAGAYARLVDGGVELRAILSDGTGSSIVRATEIAADGRALGRELAGRLRTLLGT